MKIIRLLSSDYLTVSNKIVYRKKKKKKKKKTPVAEAVVLLANTPSMRHVVTYLGFSVNNM